MSQGRARPGSAGRSTNSSPKALIRAWYEAFLTDTLHNYPSVDELPANFTDFDYVWSTFQTSNRKLRGTVVELTDFERETVLEFLRDQLHVLEFDVAQESIVWHSDQLEQVSEDRAAPQRRPWSQATNDWGAPAAPTPKDRSRVDELFWGEAPSQSALDPAWQIDWAGEAGASSGPQRTQAPGPQKTQAPAPQHQTPSVWGKSASSSGSVNSRPLSPRPTNGSGASKRDARPSSHGSSRDARSRPSNDVDDSKKRLQADQQRRPPSRSSGPVDPPPLKKRPSKPSQRDSKPNEWASIAKGSGKNQAQSQTSSQGQATNSKPNDKTVEMNATASAARKESPKKTTRSSSTEDKAPRPNADEPASWKLAEKSEKKGSGMALLGFDYL